MHHIVEQTLCTTLVEQFVTLTLMTSLDEVTRLNLMHRIADAKADAYDFIDEAARLKLMSHIRCMTNTYYKIQCISIV